jgi:hypothetical protein
MSYGEIRKRLQKRKKREAKRMMGSVAEQVVRNVHHPVLVETIRPQEPRYLKFASAR